MIGKVDISENLAFDTKSLDALRQSAHNNSPEALKSAATQFEALFVNMMMKSMRQAGSQDGMFDNEQSRLYTSMLDQQLSQKMASRGLGLADAMVRQMSNNAMSQAVQNEVQSPPALGGMAGIDQYLQQQKQSIRAAQLVENTQPIVSNSSHKHVQEFTRRLGAEAQAASAETGIPAKFMLGQAALESGWGKREIKALDGSNSHNVFGIKATASWKGRTVEATTTEYINGVPQQRVEKFRAYDSYSDAFKDYARLISQNPRYQNVMESAGDPTRFAQALQKAGYATDPYYAQKLNSIIRHSFGAT